MPAALIPRRSPAQGQLSVPVHGGGELGGLAWNALPSLLGRDFVFVNALQASGAALPALIVNVSRQGLIFIPLMLVLEPVMGSDGIVMAQPAADVLSLLLVIFFYIRSTKKTFRKE